MSNLLDKQAILDAHDIVIEEVEVLEWGGAVRVRTLSGKARDEFEQSLRTGGGDLNMANVRAKMATLTIVDANGDLIFTFAEAQKLGERSARALDRVFMVAQRLAGFSKQDLAELTENLSDGQSDASISD